MPKFAAILARRAATAARAAVARAAATPRGRKMITKARMFAAPAECMARNGLSTTTALRTGALTTITPVLAAIDPTGELELATRFSSRPGALSPKPSAPSMTATNRALHGRSPTPVTRSRSRCTTSTARVTGRRSGTA